MTRIALFTLAAASLLPGAWKAGAAAEKITPGESIWLAGYAARTRPSESVRQDIYAKALALEDGTGALSVLVTLDLIGIRRTLAEPIADAVAGRHKIPRERILFNASHTHSGPLIGDPSNYEPQMGAAYEAHARTVANYTAWLKERILAVIDKAIAARQPATLTFGQGFAGFAVNRRRVGHRDYPGPVDHDVPVLLVKGAVGKPAAVAFGYACHNTVMGDYTIHGDYAGYAQQEIERRYPGAVALFVQGAGADSNPLPRRKPEQLLRYGTTLADAVEEVIAGSMSVVEGTLSAAIEFPEVRFAPHTRDEFEQKAKSGSNSERRHAQRQLKELDRNGKFLENYPYPVQGWRFATGPTLLALGGELVVDYALRLKQKYGWDTTWVAGYSNDVFGYVPSLRVLREGGYEGGEAFLGGIFPGAFAPDIEERILSGVDRVAQRLGRR